MFVVSPSDDGSVSLAQQRVTSRQLRGTPVVGSPVKSRASGEGASSSALVIKSRERNRCGRKNVEKEEERAESSRVRNPFRVVPRPLSLRPRKMAPSCFEVILVGFILVLPFLYETSRTFRYYFKFLIYYGVVMMTAVVLMPILSLRPGNIKNFLLVAPQSIDIIMLSHIISRFVSAFDSSPRSTIITFDAFFERIVFLAVKF